MATLIQEMWEQLDAYTEVALEMGKPPKPGELDDELMTWYDSEITRIKTVAAGRGMAEAIMIACKPFFDNADEVIKLSVKRVRAAKAGESAPETPGFMGQTTGEALHAAANGVIPGSQTRKTPTRIEADPPAATQTGRKKAAPKEKLTDQQKTSIVAAHANGMGIDVETLSGMFGVPESEINQVLEAAKA